MLGVKILHRIATVRSIHPILLEIPLKNFKSKNKFAVCIGDFSLDTKCSNDLSWMLSSLGVEKLIDTVTRFYVQLD